MKEQIFKVNGKAVDLVKCVPFTMGDWENLRTETGIEPQKIETNEQTLKFVAWALRRGNAEITEDDVKTIGMRIFGKLVAHIFKLDEQAQTEGLDFDFLA